MQKNTSFLKQWDQTRSDRTKPIGAQNTSVTHVDSVSTDRVSIDMVCEFNAILQSFKVGFGSAESS